MYRPMKFVEKVFRTSEKPACISETAERASARRYGSDGQRGIDGFDSARYSATEIDSVMVSFEKQGGDDFDVTMSVGTRPLGE